MNYCTLEDILGHIPESRLIEITDDINPSASGEVNANVVDKAIQEASTTIDAYIGKRFKLPLSSVPNVLKMVCVDLVIYNLYERVTEMNVTEGMKLRYSNAIALLKRIADGDSDIGISEDDQEESGFNVHVETPTQIFTFDSMGSL